MAAEVLYSAGTEKIITATESLTKLWISPSTMDSADYFTVPTVTGATLIILSAFDNETGDAVTATVSTFTVTLDVAGGTTDKTYSVLFTYIQG